MLKYQCYISMREVKLLANIKSAQKRIRVIEHKTMVNKRRKTEIKTLIKKFEMFLQDGKIEDAKTTLKLIDKKLKKAEQKNLFHKNKVARKVSRLSQKLNRAI